MEYNLAEQYQDDYISYMQYQVKHFLKKRKMTSETIQQINKRFENMSDEAQRDYQLRWQEKYQPVIDKVHASTRAMIIRQTQDLNQEKMGKIQELTTRMELLEKEAPAVTLLPQFFVMPSLKDKF